MGPRKKAHRHENHERWLVSYADFITLLFAFFVVMYSLSSINEGKYKILAESLFEAFRPGALIQKPEELQSASMVPAVVSGVPAASQRRGGAEGEEDEREQRLREALRQAQNLQQAVRQALQPLIDEGRATVSEGAFGISIDIGSEVLFASGSASLTPQAIAVLRPIARVLAYSGDFPIKVEGHTDNVPLRRGAAFASNWELSAARAAAVVRIFEQEGVESARLAAVGYADQRPIADNATDEGRARNRRVSIRLETMDGLEPSGAPANAPTTPAATQTAPASASSILPPSLPALPAPAPAPGR